MGNICRSPTAEAVFRQKTNQINLSVRIDSAGTLAYHEGEKPDHRSLKAGVERGYDFVGIQARKVTANDFETFSLILAMDHDNLKNLLKLAPQEHAHKVKLFLDYAERFDDKEVPDPYYGGSRGFDFVLDLIEDASDGLINYIKKTY